MPHLEGVLLGGSFDGGPGGEAAAADGGGTALERRGDEGGESMGVVLASEVGVARRKPSQETRRPNT